MKDYIVIGGGAIGLATAYRLKKSHKDQSVTVIDSKESGTASLASGAMLGCFGEVTKYTLQSDANKKKFELMYAAHKQWTTWREEIEADAGQTIKHIPGSYVILNTQGGALDDENFDAMIEALNIYNESYEYVMPKDIPGLHPNHLARPLRAVYLPNEGSIDSNQYVTVLETACKNIGVEVTSITSLHSIDSCDAMYTVSFDETTVTSPVVIVATGAYTSSVLAKVSPTLSAMPVLAGNGVATVTKRQVGEGFTATVRTANRAGSCGLHVVPMGDGYEYLGATNVLYSEPESRMTIGLSHFLAQCAIEQLDLNIYHSFVETWRVGNRPVSLDTLPLIGKVDDSSLYLATGTYRDGLHCSPVIADALITLIDGGNAPIIEDFTPKRSFTQLMSKEDSANEYAMQAVSGAYENWYRPTYYMNDDEIYQNAHKKATDIYDQLGTNIGLHPDILLLLSSDEKAVKNVGAYLQSINQPES
ncbi:MAG TPA: FAD-dependent oxidoreductase [Candidatus Microsaccharimonas sp.]|jgi:glycine/D-amino acid oxidase-like deaminating enzyme